VLASSFVKARLEGVCKGLLEFVYEACLKGIHV